MLTRSEAAAHPPAVRYRCVQAYDEPESLCWGANDGLPYAASDAEWEEEKVEQLYRLLAQCKLPAGASEAELQDDMNGSVAWLRGVLACRGTDNPAAIRRTMHMHQEMALQGARLLQALIQRGLVGVVVPIVVRDNS